MTLTEFLLARIAEDEAAVRKALDSPFYVSGTPWGDTYEAIADEPNSSRTDFHLAVDPARVLAECKAKRKQIAHLIDFMEGDYAPWNEDQLKMMAEVYADHPDFDESWRP